MKKAPIIIGTIIVVLIVVSIYIKNTSIQTSENSLNIVDNGVFEKTSSKDQEYQIYEKVIDNTNIKLKIPINWKYEELAQNTENDFYKFALKLYHNDTNRYATLYYYRQPFAVCGTGRTSNQLDLDNGNKATIGYYDGNSIWQDISFFETNKYIAILNTELNEEEANDFLDIIKTITIEESKETLEYIYGWKDESIEGKKMISEDMAVKIAKEYANSLVNTDSLGYWLEKYTKVHEVSLTQKYPNNYWLLKKDDSNQKYLVANYKRTIYEVILVPYDDDVELERAHFYVDAYTGKVIGGMQTGD